jgi:L-fucose dehydrogenase
MDLQLQGKVIIVTGGAKGIGEGIARVLAQEGAIPVIVGRKAADNEQAVAAIEAAGGQAGQVVAELAEPAECERAVQAVVAQFGRIDGLVNNAGVNDGVGLENGDYQGFMQSLHRNVVHYYLMAHHALPELKKSQGAIVNITSKTAETGQGNTSAYAAAYGIRVNAVMVAECWTPAYETWVQTLPNPEEKLREITSKIPLGNRMTTAEEIANTTAFLLSARSSHTTGQILHIDGGYVHLDRALANA